MNALVQNNNVIISCELTAVEMENVNGGCNAWEITKSALSGAAGGAVTGTIGGAISGGPVGAGLGYVGGALGGLDLGTR